MAVSRTERRERLKTERRRLRLAAALLALGAAALSTAAALALIGPQSVSEPATIAEPLVTETVESVVPTTVPVEVPDVTGDSLAQAEMVLAYAGFEVQRAEVETVPGDPNRVVLSQQPTAGVRTEPGVTVTLYFGTGAVPAAPRVQRQPDWQHIVCIDAGHQRRSDQRPEPVGPGSQETKMRVTGGTVGVSTGRPEYVLTLEVARRVSAKLKAAGVKVVMTRIEHDVSISNAERATIANRAGAELFLRIHADGSTDRRMRGISTLYPARNTWTAPIATRSQRAAKSIHSATLAATGAADRGMRARGDLTGFNWAEVPAILVECGYLSNPSEDERLSTEAYQERLATGISQGVMAYLEGE